ncbi:MAG: long-chain fatty acid--CoA ligase [Planctomycetota bacterium]
MSHFDFNDCPPNLRRLLESRVEEGPDRPFLLGEPGRRTRGEVRDRAAKVARQLHALGVAPRDRVVLVTANRPEFIDVFFGTTGAGFVPVPLNPALRPPELRYIIDNSQAKVVITESAHLESVRAAISDLPDMHCLTFEPTQGERSLAELEETGDGFPTPEPTSESEAALIYTSGTTGKPKGVILTHKNYIANAYQIIAAGSYSADDRFLCVLPVFHVNAQVVTILAPLAVGGSLVLLPGFSPEPFVEALEHFRPTVFSAVPTVYAILLQHPAGEGRDLSSLRYCICGAAPMPEAVFRAFEQKFQAKIIEGYGLSEGTCGSAVNPVDRERKIGTVGLALPGQEIRIVDDRGDELPRGEIGELIVRGDNVMKGYFQNPEATAQTLRDGWLHTGDLAHMDGDGYITISGRKKEMIIRGGANIYPREIEEVLHHHPAIAEAAVVGEEDEVWGEIVSAHIVLAPGQNVTEDELTAYCSDQLADYKCPVKWTFRDSLPKTATGKVQKRNL